MSARKKTVSFAFGKPATGRPVRVRVESPLPPVLPHLDRLGVWANSKATEYQRPFQMESPGGKRQLSGSPGPFDAGFPDLPNPGARALSSRSLDIFCGPDVSTGEILQFLSYEE